MFKITPNRVRMFAFGTLMSFTAAGAYAAPQVADWAQNRATHDLATAGQDAPAIEEIADARLEQGTADAAPAIASVETLAADTAPESLFPADELADADYDRAVECIAKVVHHEASNQAREGRLAVAQLIVTRWESGRFANSVCGVVAQPGQFFNVNTYHPNRDKSAWKIAVEVAREALSHDEPQVVPGALFYHAAYAAPNRFFRSRTRVAKLEDHIFYR